MTIQRGLPIRCACIVLLTFASDLRAQEEASPTLVVPRKPAGSTTPLAPEDEAATFHLPPGFRIELVASEPLLREPVMCAFDGDGRLFVAEMCTYMQDIDGTGEDAAQGRISMLFDTDGDGRMDRRTTFADGLVLPRLLLPLADGVLVGETYTTALWLYRDADGDGVADGRERVREGKADKRNLEHQDSALTYGIDNWIYTAMGGERLRWRQGVLHSEKVDSEFAQWGLAVDDVGRQFFASAGGERPAYGFQRHPRYGRASFAGELAPSFVAVFPRVATPDVQGGEARLRPDGTLNHMTGCCGQSIFRGDALPADCVGDYFVCEPVGRLVRRARVHDEEGKLVLTNRHEGDEFWTSTDMNFRPVWSATGPDGALWVVDMYRGIIQEGNWVKPGSYLRPQVEKLGLDKNIGRGRIWRVVADGHATRPALALQRADDRALVAALADANGFWRDTAQKLLVLRGRTQASPRVRELLRHAFPLARVHALWTLEGLGELTREDVARGVSDPDPRVRLSAVRASEAFVQQGDAAVLALLAPLVRDDDVQVAAQLASSLRFAAATSGREALLATLAHRPDNEVIASAVRDSLRGDRQGDGVEGVLDRAALDLVREGKTHYQQLCIACHGADGRGVEASGVWLAPPLVDSPRVGNDEALIRIVLHGLVGPIDGKVWGGGLMAGQGAQDDRYIAAVLSYVRTMFGDAGAVMPADVAAVRASCSERAAPWTIDELSPFAAISAAEMAGWTATASHASEHAGRALDGDPESRYTTETPMVPGMWWCVDLRAEHAITRVVLDCRRSEKDYPRGFVVEAADDGESWREVARGAGDGPITKVRLPHVRLHFLRITQTGESADWWWSIHRAAFFGRRL